MKNSIHSFFRFWIKVTSYFFFDKVKIAGLENLPANSPVIFACNHPNAFLDSIVMTTWTKRPLYYTARGDFFESKIASVLLHAINILPVYRREEGKELMYKNNETFSYCIEVFKKNGALIIFSEGISENKYELRPLRKGTARLAFEAWSNPEIGDKLKVVPVAIHYSSWLKIRPVVYVEFLKNIERKSFIDITESGTANKKFNDLLKTTLAEKCILVDKDGDAVSQQKIVGFCLKNFINGASNVKEIQNRHLVTDNKKFKSDYKTLSDFLVKENINYDLKSELGVMKIINLIAWVIVLVPAFVCNFIPYYIGKFIAWKTTKGNDFHDSILYCLLMLIYPIYLLALFFITTVYANYIIGLLNVFLAAYSAYYYEAAKRYILSFFKRKELIIVHDMFNRLFEKGSG